MEAATPESPAPRRRPRRAWLGVLAVLAVAVAAFVLLRGGRSESTENAYVKIDHVVISPKVSGYVTAVEVADNQPVPAGQVLLRIDPTDFAAKVAQEEATLRGREAALQALTRRRVLNEAEIAEADHALRAAGAQAEKLDVDAQRFQKLLEDGYATRDQTEVRATNARVAMSAQAQAQAKLTGARGQGPILQAQEAQLRAEIEQSRATIELLQLDLKNATLVAPGAGIVANKSVEVGQYVRAGSQLLTLVLGAKAYVVANFKETQIGALRAGQRAQLSIDAYPSLKLSGRVASIAPATGAEFSLLPPENATGNFTKVVQRLPTRIELDAGQPGLELLRSGMSAVVTVSTEGAGHAAGAEADKSVALRD